MNKENVKDEGSFSDQGDYGIAINYSDEAKEKKLIKFTTKRSGDTFEIPADAMIELVAHYVKGDELAPMLVDTERIKVVQVDRDISFMANKDIKKGEKFNVKYTHPYPLEFAIIESAFNIAKIREDREAYIVTLEDMKKVERETPIQSTNFIKKFYKAFQNIALGGQT